MTDKKNNLILLLGSILLSSSVVINYFLQDYISTWISVCIYIGLSFLYILILVGIKKQKQSLYKFSIVGYSIIIVFMLIFGSIFWSGLYLEFYNENGEIVPENIANVIGNASGSKWIFIALAFLQVTFVPISSSIVTMAGVILFGPAEGFLFSLIGQVLGSVVAFYLGRIFGEKFVIWIVGKDNFQKYRNIIKGRDKIMLFFMFLLPFFPDDLLCMFAGLTTFTGFTFTLMVIFTRSIAIGTATLGVELFSEIMKLGGWAYLIFAIILLVVIALFVVVWKYGDKLEYKILAFLNKILPEKFRKIVVSDKAIDVFSQTNNQTKNDKQADNKNINNKNYLDNEKVLNNQNKNIDFDKQIDEKNNNNES